jgi:hypothetical protein
VTDAVPPGADPAGEAAAVLVGEDPLRLMMDAGQPVITAPEDMAEIPQIPYAKTDRVPELGRDLERHVCEVLTERTGYPHTPGMIRLERGRALGDPADPDGFAGLFAALSREGGSVLGHLAAAQSGETFTVGTVTTYGGAERDLEALDLV